MSLYYTAGFLARKIIVNAQVSNDVSSLLSELLTHQNFDGGFGDSIGFDSSVLDTVFALEALAAAGVESGPDVAGAVGFVLNEQQPDGGWADGANELSVYLCAFATRALAPYRDTFVCTGMYRKRVEWALSRTRCPCESALSQGCFRATVIITFHLCVYRLRWDRRI